LNQLKKFGPWSSLVLEKVGMDKFSRLEKWKVNFFYQIAFSFLFYEIWMPTLKSMEMINFMNEINRGTLSLALEFWFFCHLFFCLGWNKMLKFSRTPENESFLDCLTKIKFFCEIFFFVRKFFFLSDKKKIFCYHIIYYQIWRLYINANCLPMG